MKKIEWKKYLSEERFRESEFKKRQEQNLGDYRNAFESDFGRVVFSSAIRRMHDKAQVIPLTNGDSVHTRLTHSAEVMSIARSLGVDYCRSKKIEQDYTKEELLYMERTIPVILQTAAFVHDIGNPPFGHFGETITQNYFKRRFNPSLPNNFSDYADDSQKLDFTLFDGNAQGFRILTKLQYIGDLSGLNLTYATLATYLKYPNLGQIDKGYIGTKKHGVFTQEKAVFDKMVESCNLRRDDNVVKRHPLSFLVEAADSICYNIMDVEDGFSLDWYSFDEIVEFLNKDIRERIGTVEVPQEYQSDGKFDICKLIGFSPILKKENHEMAEKSHKRKMVDFRVKVIVYLVRIAVDNFIKNQESIERGYYTQELIEQDAYHLSEALQAFASTYIYPRKEIELVELTGNSVLNGLYDKLFEYIFQTDELYRKRAKSLLSKTGLKVAIHEGLEYRDSYRLISDKDLTKFDLDDLPQYMKLRLVVDLVSGMTDKFAVSMYQQLSGQKL